MLQKIAIVVVVATLTITSFAQAAWAQRSARELQAMTYVNSHDFRGLVQYAQQWVRDEPNNGIAWYYLGAAYGRGLGDAQASIVPLERAVALKPSPTFYYALGVAYTQTQQWAKAIAPIRRATELRPQHQLYWTGLAAAYAGAYRFTEARQALDAGVAAAGPYMKAYNWYNFGISYNQLREPEKAVAMYKKAVAMYPTFAQGFNNLGAQQQILGNYGEALDDFQRAGALGDPLGTQNYEDLQHAIAAAKEHANAAQGLSYGRLMHMWSVNVHMQEHPLESMSDAERDSH